MRRSLSRTSRRWPRRRRRGGNGHGHGHGHDLEEDKGNDWHEVEAGYFASIEVGWFTMP